MILLAVDPGNTQSAYVRYANGVLLEHGKHENAVIRGVVSNADRPYDVLAVEMIASYGMPVGAEVFETCVEIGRLVQIAEAARFAHLHDQPPLVSLVYRRDVKLHLCGSMRAKDANVRQSLIDRFGPGRDAAIGTKKKPGPLYGVAADIWAALAIAVTWSDTHVTKECAA